MTAALIAMKDITADRKKEKRNVSYYQMESGETHSEIWDVTTEYLYTAEQRALNKALGISYINNGGKRVKK